MTLVVLQYGFLYELGTRRHHCHHPSLSRQFASDGLDKLM
jgi:hypothetical protein